MHEPSSAAEQVLVLRRLYSMVFVEDYVQLLFELDAGEDDDLLHLDFFVLPKVRTGQRTFEPAEVGWAWALRTLIGSTVVAFRASPEAGLELELEAGAVSLQADQRFDTAVEVALLEAPGLLEVWRPGEGPFQAG